MTETDDEARPNSPEDLGFQQPEPPAAPHHEPHRCDCTAPILWAQVLKLDDKPGSPTRGKWIRAKRDNGKGYKAMPVDYHPTPLGNVVIFQRRNEGIVARVFKDSATAAAAFPGAPLRTSHFMTCPQATQFRRGKKGRRR